MKTIVMAAGILTVGLAVEAADTVRATLEPSTNGPGCFTMRITNVSTHTIRFLDIREGTGWCGEFYEIIVEKGGVTNASRGNCLYSPAGMPETVELAPGRVYGRDIQPVAYLGSEKHLSPPCSIRVAYRLTDRIRADWRTSGANVDLVFQTEKLAIGSSNPLLPADPAALIVTLTSTSATWEARCRAEDALANGSPSGVLTLLLPHAGANRPSGMIWNSAGRDSERDMPADWQRLYAVRRAWDTQARRLTDAEHKTFWLELLAKAGTPGPRVTVIHELTEHWTPAAEPVLSKLIADAGQELPVRVVAGRCLALHAARATHNNLVSLFEKAGSFAEREQWFDIASDPRHKNEVGEDPRIVRQGFTLLAEERKRSSNYVHGAYFIAVKIGNYVGAKNQFQPELTFWYRGSNGPTEAFFSDTVRNAERWWAKNRVRIEAEENAAAKPRFALFLVAGKVGEHDLRRVDPAGLTLAAEPLFTEKDIVSYDWEKHDIEIRSNAVARIPHSSYGGMFVPFVVMAGGERCYAGFFSGAEDARPIDTTVPSILTCSRADGNARIHIGYGYDLTRQEGMPAGDMADRRNSPRLRDALREAGVLRAAVPELHEAMGAAEFGAAVIGRWESAFDLPGRTNVTRAEFRSDGTATVVVTGGGRKTQHTGPCRLEFERPPASNMVTFARIVVESNDGALVLSRVNFGLHNGVSRDRMLLRIEGEPHGALGRAAGTISAAESNPDR